MTYFTYGLAILANTDHLHLTEPELREAFRREFRALLAIYGKPAGVCRESWCCFMKLSFSRLGLVLFVLPMLINLAYVMFPPAEEAKADGAVPRWVEGIEQVSRAAYLFAVTFLVSREPIEPRSVWPLSKRLIARRRRTICWI